MDRGARNVLIVIGAVVALVALNQFVSLSKRREQTEDAEAFVRWEASIEASPEGIARRRAEQQAIERQRQEQWQRELESVGRSMPTQQPTSAPTEGDSTYVPHYRTRHGGSWYRRRRGY